MTYIRYVIKTQLMFWPDSSLVLTPVILVDCSEPIMQRSILNRSYTNAVMPSVILLHKFVADIWRGRTVFSTFVHKCWFTASKEVLNLSKTLVIITAYSFYQWLRYIHKFPFNMICLMLMHSVSNSRKSSTFAHVATILYFQLS